MLSSDYRLTPISDLKTWELTDFGLKSKNHDSRYLELYEVHAKTREVASWTQPLLGARGKGRACLYRCIYNDAPHYAVSVINEYGINGGSIIAPSELIYPGNQTSKYATHGTLHRSFEHSEEGGRFINHSSLFEIRNVNKDFQLADNQFWVSAAQLKQLFLTSNMIAIQLRVIASALFDELNPCVFRKPVAS